METARYGSFDEPLNDRGRTSTHLSPVEAVEGLGAIASRTMDLTLVVAMLPVLLPALGIAVFLVKSDDLRAPIFFRQIRYGRYGLPFQIVKLRTMVPDAEARKAELLERSEDKGAGFKLDNDPRITRVGHWLRKLYIDEIPQIWNVVRGDMALVGPRANSYSPDVYEPWQRARLLVKPGLTGSWQIARDKPKLFSERCRMDLIYVRNKCLITDVKILFGTVGLILSGGRGV